MSSGGPHDAPDTDAPDTDAPDAGRSDADPSAGGGSDSAAAYRALLEMMRTVHECRTVRQLEFEITARVADVIPADLVTLNKIDLTGTMGGSIGLFVPEFVSSRLIEPAFDRFVHQHPLVNEIRRTGDGRPRRMSDFTDMDEFRRTELYEHVFKPLRSLHQIGFSVQQVPGIVIGIGVNRTHHDFTDAELEIANVMFDQIPSAYHHVQLREIHDRQQQLDGAPDLSAREREILVYLRAGQSNQQIANALHVGRRTIEKHLERLYAKLGVRSRTAAINAVWPPA